MSKQMKVCMLIFVFTIILLITSCAGLRHDLSKENDSGGKLSIRSKQAIASKETSSYWYPAINAPAHVTLFMHMLPLAHRQPGMQPLHIWITISQVQLINEESNRGTIIFEGSKKYDLLTIQTEMPIVIADKDIASGNYNQIILQLTRQVNIETEDGTQEHIDLAPPAQAEIKIAGSFQSTRGKQLRIYLNFDVENSLRLINGRNYQITPTITVRRAEEIDNRYLKAVQNEVLLKMSLVDNVKVAAFISSHKLTIKSSFSLDGVNSLARVQHEYKSVTDTIAELLQDPRVLAAEPNYTLRAFIKNVQDPFYKSQWNLKKAFFPYAWDITQGRSDVVIAVLDTGVAADIAEFTGRILSGHNTIENSANTSDDSGHGTAVASVIAAIPNNNVGIAGIDWKAKILPIKVLDNNGIGTYWDLVEGIRYAAANSAKVINISAGGYVNSEILHDAVNYALAKKNVTIIAAVGNDGSFFSIYPASYYGVLGVGSTDENDHVDPMTNYGDSVDVLAPGIQIPALSRQGTPRIVSGSSMAAPHVAGLASLIISIDSNLSWKQVSNLIVEFSDRTSDTSRYQGLYGHGRINALRTLNSLRPHEGVRDIGIFDARFEKNAAFFGRNNMLEVYLQNTGTTAATNTLSVTERTENASSMIGSKQVSLPPGDISVITFQYNPQEGKSGVQFEIKLMAREDNPTNDRILFNGKILPAEIPDIRLGIISASLVDADKVRETLRAIVPVENVGSAELGLISIKFKLLETEQDLGQVEITDLKVGKRVFAEVTFDLPKTTDGKTFHLTARTKCCVEENNEVIFSIGKYSIPEGYGTGISMLYPVDTHRYITEQALILFQNSPVFSNLNDEGRLFFNKYRDNISASASVPDNAFVFIPTLRGDEFGAINGMSHFWLSDEGDTGSSASLSSTHPNFTYWYSVAGINYINLNGVGSPLSVPDLCYYIPNAWESVKTLWGNPYHLGAPCSSWRNNPLTHLTELPLSDALAVRLGMISHYLVDVTTPAHAHGDAHAGILGINDDSYEDWLKKMPLELFEVRGTNIVTTYYGRGRFGDEHIVAEPYGNVVINGLLGIPDSHYQSVPAELFPLYHLLYRGNQYGDYFASDAVDGNQTDRNRWINFASLPGRPIDAAQLSNNDCGGDFCSAGDNDDDGDLNKIATVNYTYGIRAVATFFCWFADSHDWWITTINPMINCCPIAVENPAPHLKSNGEYCTQGHDCQSGHCVDSHCCASASCNKKNCESCTNGICRNKCIPPEICWHDDPIGYCSIEPH